MPSKLVAEWIASFPKVKLNLVYESTGDWLCWAVLRGYGTVLWRSYAAPGSRIVWDAYKAAQLPLLNGALLPPHACWMHGQVDLKRLEKQLQEEIEDRLNAPPQRTVRRKKSAADSAAHSPNTLQQTLDLQHTGCSGSTLSPYGGG